MDSPEHCDDNKKSNYGMESNSTELVLSCERKTSKMDTKEPDVVEELCKNYFAALKADLFLSSLYLVITSNVVLISVLLAFAKVSVSMPQYLIDKNISLRPI